MKKIITGIILYLSVNYAPAQLLTINSTLSLVSDTLFVTSNVSIGSTGEYYNQLGVLVINDTFSNHGKCQSQGKEIFSGDHTQTIIGSLTGLNYLGHIMKNNTGNINCTTTLTSRSLTFSQDGLITIPRHDSLIITDPNPLSIQGYSEQRHILLDSLSILNRAVNDTINAYTFPVGYINSYKPLTIHFISLGYSGTSTAGVSIHTLDNASLSVTRPLPQCLITDQSQHLTLNCLEPFYWSLTGPGDYDYFLETSVPPTCGFYPHRIVISSSSQITWDSIDYALVGSTDYNLCNFTTWDNTYQSIIGGIYHGITKRASIASNQGSVLPVTLTSFTAIPYTRASILLKWTTASEIDNARFIITRSTDGYSFIPIGEVAGNGTSYQIQSYEYEDIGRTPHQTYYYRLIQEDYDGSFQKSTIVSATINQDNEPVYVTVRNLLGQTIIHYVSTNPDNPYQEIPSSLRNQLYIITTITGSHYETRRIFLP